MSFMLRNAAAKKRLEQEAKKRVRAAIRAAEAEADKDVFISSAAMDAWARSWGSDEELPPPQPDIFPPRR